MMIRGSAAGLFAGGIMLWMLCKMIPFLAFILMDWVAMFMMIGAMFILFFCFGISGVGLQYDTIPPGTAVINYIRRDGIVSPLLGKRIFSGESFLDVPKLGLIEDLGQDTVFLWGRKKVRFGLENINYTPDPRYWNMCKELYELGFDDMDDVYNVMNIPNMTATEEAKKVYYLTRMADIYWNMTHQSPRGAEKLIKLFGKKREKNVELGPRRRNKMVFKEEEARVETKPEAKTEKPETEMTDDERKIIINRLIGEIKDGRNKNDGPDK